MTETEYKDQKDIKSSVYEKEYSEEEQKDALISLAPTDPREWNDSCDYLHGYDRQVVACDGDDVGEGKRNFFENGHKLSMLQKITATRILDYRSFLSNTSGMIPTIEELHQLAQSFQAKNGPTLNLLECIQSQSPSMALAAEFKRASPSKGDIAPNLDAGEQARLYADAGASVISVLTEERWFKGSLEDLTKARQTTASPTKKEFQRPAILRKDFCISKYMIAEALAHGADTILLIVAITPRPLLKSLIDYARHQCHMEPLVEVHAPSELDAALQCGAKVIGVNNRNLHNFTLDLSTTEKTAQQLAKLNVSFHHDSSTEGKKNNSATHALCALSGMSTAEDVHRYRQSGVGMVLIGESLMRATDPCAAIRGLCLNPTDYMNNRNDLNNSTQNDIHDNQNTGNAAYTQGTTLVKVCGITNPIDAKVACEAGANLIGVIFAKGSKRKVDEEQAKLIVQAVRQFGERGTSQPSSFTPLYDKEENIQRPTSDTIRSLSIKAKILQEASRRPLVVGVFQNQSHEFIKTMVTKCNLDVVQLHGKEGMEAASVEKCGVPAIRVVDIVTNAKDESHNQNSTPSPSSSSHKVETILSNLTSHPLAILLDTSIKGSKEGGGTGITFDWAIAEHIQNRGLPVIIAGGLKPTNISDAIQIARPWGVDVSSGVEAEPGKKNHDAVKDFLTNARKAAILASQGF
mmetsp:Transcript_9404/g.13347  ORF Transcript_9404/g.13347 Transcript_9404/m.13347 type:complete len:690 (-) Transcript_9404:65-2134(-)|eukprot:CAMPEP_0184874112 /NCGR_PEP_ID=MMETSP0580-20130426/42215_1 /TAXON_ID=1118495 /ORGANISM="Dactyliosolen fragilissimus" /LENGTH=689 /DNA_ID=CAMNT_0027377087 /DNA_START=9 /DNA_END=2078 /DNA_ORIENTATION=-